MAKQRIWNERTNKNIFRKTAEERKKTLDEKISPIKEEKKKDCKRELKDDRQEKQT